MKRKSVSTEIEDPMLLTVIDKIRENPKLNNDTIEYTGSDGKKYVSVLKNMPARGWALVLSDSEKEIFAQAYSSRTVLGIICLISVILISLISLP
jgi:hypothetical protein